MNINCENAIEKLQTIFSERGYVTVDDILDTSEKHELSLQDIDSLSSKLTEKGVLIIEDAFLSDSSAQLEETTDYENFAHVDYEDVYLNVLAVEPAANAFINEIKKIVPPQWKEFEQLKYQIREGNKYARNRVIEMYLRIAVKIALQRSIEFDIEFLDVLEDACIGLITAVDRYDPDVNGSFQSYASISIFQSLSRRQPTKSSVYYSAQRKADYYNVYPYFKEHGCLECELFAKCEKALKFAQKITGVKGTNARYIIDACIPLYSYEVLVEEIENNGMGTMPSGLISDFDIDEIVLNADLKKVISKCLSELSKREQDILIARYGLEDGEEKTLEELGKEYGLTRERIRQIESKALRKLRLPSRIKNFEGYY